MTGDGEGGEDPAESASLRFTLGEDRERQSQWFLGFGLARLVVRASVAV